MILADEGYFRNVFYVHLFIYIYIGIFTNMPHVDSSNLRVRGRRSQKLTNLMTHSEQTKIGVFKLRL
jgi:hypothetical protein